MDATVLTLGIVRFRVWVSIHFRFYGLGAHTFFELSAAVTLILSYK